MYVFVFLPPFQITWAAVRSACEQGKIKVISYHRTFWKIIIK